MGVVKLVEAAKVTATRKARGSTCAATAAVKATGARMAAVASVSGALPQTSDVIE
jgi:hypothetical protein